jgi:hypothetical protein
MRSVAVRVRCLAGVARAGRVVILSSRCFPCRRHVREGARGDTGIGTMPACWRPLAPAAGWRRGMGMLLTGSCGLYTDELADGEDVVFVVVSASHFGSGVVTVVGTSVVEQANMLVSEWASAC